MLIGKGFKHPEENKRYGADFTDWLADGETLNALPSGVTFEVTPDDGTTPLVISNKSLDTDSKKVLFFVGGGDDGVTYEVLITAVTSLGQTKQVEYFFVVADPQSP